MLRAAYLGIALLLLTGCEDDEPKPDHRPPEVSSSRTESPSAPPAKTTEERSLLGAAAGCQLQGAGVTIDFGEPVAGYRRTFDPGPPRDLTPLDRAGARFGSVEAAKIEYDFWLTEAWEKVALGVRLHATGSRRMSAYLDGRYYGSLRLVPGKTTIERIKPRPFKLTSGRHRLALRFSKPVGDSTHADLEWLHLSPELLRDGDRPPTRADAFADVTIDEQTRRSVALRQGGRYVCPLWVSSGTKLRLRLGIWGPGNGAAEIRIRPDASPAVSLGVHEVEPGEWIEIEEGLDAFSDQIVQLEFETVRASPSSRIAFGSPELMRRIAARPSHTGAARRVIVVLLSGLSRRHHPPLGAGDGLSALAAFAKNAAYFPGYRTPTTIVPSVVASLLTGLPPRAHGLTDDGATLSPSIPTVAEEVTGNGGEAAMFTGVPMTFAGFGLNRGWEIFDEVSPVADLAATEPLVRARAWLEARLGQERTQLLVVHLRGGHPPFDITQEEARELPPKEYGGDLEPRRAAIQLSSIRGRRLARHRRMPDEDWVRLDAMQAAALRRQDRALGEFFSWLHSRGADDDTLLIVAGDVAAGERPTIPFAPAGPLGEELLQPPLFVRFPGASDETKEVTTSITTTDLTATIRAALGLPESEAEPGTATRDLGPMATSPPGAPAVTWHAPLEATLGDEYSTRAGGWILRGEFGRVPMLCARGADPACTNDVAEAHPLIAEALWRMTYELERQAREQSPERSPTELDPEEEAALTVWGAVR